MWQEIFSVIFIGVGIASTFFWLLIIIRTTDTKRGVGAWIKIFIPQGIFIAWALKLLGVI